MKKICLLYILLTALCACTSVSIDTELSTIEAVMPLRPDSALTMLQAIDSRRLSRADNARYALLLTQAKDKCFIDETNDSLINIAVKYYRHENNMRYKGLSYFYLSRVYENAGNYDEALSNSILAEEALLHTTDHNAIALVYANRADIYTEQYRYRDAITPRDKAILHYEKCNNHKNIVYAYLSSSRCYMLLKEANLALKLIEKAREVAQKEKSHDILFNVENYLASYYEYNKEPTKAIATIKAAFVQYKEHTPNADDYLLLCRIYHSIGQNDSALYYLDNFYAPTCQTASDYKTLNLFRSEIYKKQCNYRRAYEALHEYQHIVSKSGILEQNKSLPELEKKYRTQILQHKNKALRMRNSALLVILLLTIVIAVLFVLLFIKQRHLRIAQYEQFCEQLSHNISSMQQRYDKIKLQLKKQRAENILYNNALGKRVDSLISLLNILEKYDNRKDICYDKIRAYFSLCNDNKDSFANEIREITSLYCNNFVSLLQEEYPTLSDEEINLCCMIVLGFDNNHIRILFNHTSSQSIYNKRTRLRKKLNIYADQDLETFLANIRNKVQSNDN